MMEPMFHSFKSGLPIRIRLRQKNLKQQQIEMVTNELGATYITCALHDLLSLQVALPWA